MERKAAGSPKECGAGRLEAQLDTLQKFQEEYENALSDIQNAQESMSDKLRDYGDLFTTVKGEAGGSFIELGDLQADIDAINRYGDALEQLKSARCIGQSGWTKLPA